MAEKGPERTVTIPLVPGTLKSVPRFYANYVQCSVTSMDVTLTFCQRFQEGDEAEELALPQMVCTMSHAHFLAFARMIEVQRDALRSKGKEIAEAIAKMEAESAKAD